MKLHLIKVGAWSIPTTWISSCQHERVVLLVQVVKLHLIQAGDLSTQEH